METLLESQFLSAAGSSEGGISYSFVEKAPTFSSHVACPRPSILRGHVDLLNKDC